MIVDADCHISPLKEGVNITADELLRQMGGVGVDKAQIMGRNLLGLLGVPR